MPRRAAAAETPSYSQRTGARRAWAILFLESFLCATIRACFRLANASCVSAPEVKASRAVMSLRLYEPNDRDDVCRIPFLLFYYYVLSIELPTDTVRPCHQICPGEVISYRKLI